MSDIEIEVFNVDNELFVNNKNETEIEVVDNTIEIDISGLKTIKRFIGLEDTPLYYENDKFFKVEGNKIVYADIQWRDITGNMSENKDLLKEVEELVEDASLDFVNAEIQKHNKDVSAHGDIRQSITNASNILDSKIDSSINKLEQQISSLSGNIETNKNDIIDLKQKDNTLQEQIDNINTSIGENVAGKINKLEQRVATSELNIENNTIDIANLKDKNENIQGQIDDINTVLSIDVANKINLLQQEVDENYIELNSNKVDKEAGKGLSSNDLTDDLLNQIEANTLNRHNHDNKDVLDLINAPFTREDKTKLDNIEDGAQVNTVTSVNGQIGDVYIPQLEQVQSDWKSVNPESKAYILNKPTKLSDFENDVEYITKDVDNLTNYTQTGVINNLLFKKVDKEVGKGLSTNDFTDELLQKLESIEEGAEKNIVTSVNGKIGDVFLDIMELDKDQIVTGQKIFLNDVIIGNTDKPQNLNLTGNSNILGDLNIEGNIIQNGEQYETHVQKVYSTNDYITLRDGAVSGLIPGNYSGLEFKLYDGINNGRLVIDNSGTARVGDIGDEQPLLTRDETTNLTNKGVLVWDAENYKAKTSTEYSKTEDFALVAFTGNYSDLNGVPTKLSQFEDDITPAIQDNLTETQQNVTEIQNDLTEVQQNVTNLETQKQDVLTSENAGEGISIVDGIISNTKVSAEWGNIQGDITSQADLQNDLKSKASVDLDNLSEAGEQKLQSLGSKVLVDDVTIVKNEEDIISTQAVLNSNEKYTLQGVKTWTGTLKEYNDIEVKDDTTLYYITDDVSNSGGTGGSSDFAGVAEAVVDNNDGQVTIWTGTLAEYEAIETHDSDMLYYITDDDLHVSSNTLANTDLSNLTDVGQSKLDEKANKTDLDTKANKTDLDTKVNKAGDIMTGALTIENNGNSYIYPVRPDVKLGDTPASQQNLGGIRIYAGNRPGVGNAAAMIQGYVDTYNSTSRTGIQFITRKPDDSGWGTSMRLYTNADGSTCFDFPKCSTKATTTSSANLSNVAVIVQNYVNGTSWYRVWSDGWIEQGGVTTDTVGKITYNLLKTYSNANYTLTLGCTTSGSDGGGGAFPGISAKTNSSFTIYYDYTSTNKNKGVNWYACGY